MTHVMIDLETMDTRPSAAIVSIGAVAFDREQGVASEFYSVVDLTSSIETGGTVSGDTILWWMRQSEFARRALSTDRVPVGDSLGMFDSWFRSLGDVVGVWGNGSSFDNVILRETYGRLGLETPWSWRLDRCYRTVKKTFEAKNSGWRPRALDGVVHNALDDARHQALVLLDIWQQDS